jgi:sterol desaturase/sphingolipid hydroxylase (fatty acid hydroxylase superfamily)
VSPRDGQSAGACAVGTSRVRTRSTQLPPTAGMVASATNYRLAMVGDRVAALAFLIFGLRSFEGGLSLTAGLILLGVLAFGLLEYAVHRWVLHGPPSFATRGHSQHHARPAALIATPPFVVIIAALAIGAVLSLVCAAGAAALVVFGMYAGYNYFALLHHWEHHHRRDVSCGAYWRRLDRSHRLHHRQEGVNFGVSTTIWDRVFGTFRPAD